MTNNKEINKAIGRRLRTMRHILNLSQQDLAKDLDFTYQQLQKYEAGTNNVSVYNLDKIAKALGTSAIEVMKQADYDFVATNNASTENNDETMKTFAKVKPFIETLDSLDNLEIQRSIINLYSALSAYEEERKLKLETTEYDNRK